MEILNIPPLEEEDLYEGNEELWKYGKFDRNKNIEVLGKFFVSNYGRVYSIEQRRLLPIYESDFFKSSVAKYRLCDIPLDVLDKKKKTSSYLVHRLVAMAFLEKDPERPLVNHIDGNPSNNYVWNLEWCNTSENYHHAYNHGLVKHKRGEERKSSKWTDNEVHAICKMMEDGHKATYIYKTLLEVLHDPKVEYERVRALYKHIIKRTHWSHISKYYDIDFTRNNFAKEKTSIWGNIASSPSYIPPNKYQLVP